MEVVKRNPNLRVNCFSHNMQEAAYASLLHCFAKPTAQIIHFIRSDGAWPSLL